VKPGEEWGVPTDAAPDAVVRGDDAMLAAFLADRPDGSPLALVRFVADGSDLARAVGWSGRHAAPDAVGGIAVELDAIDTDAGLACNAVVVGVAPPRLRAWHRRRPVTVTVDGRTTFAGAATTVVIANGQYLGDADLVPRGHPGDGRLEVQVYSLRPTERGPMRRRLASGTHLPHPRIVSASGRSVRVTAAAGPRPVALDGRPVGGRSELTAAVRHPAVRLLL